MTTITCIEPNSYQIDLVRLSLFFDTDDCDADMAREQKAEAERLVAKVNMHDELLGTVKLLKEAVYQQEQERGVEYYGDLQGQVNAAKKAADLVIAKAES